MTSTEASASAALAQQVQDLRARGEHAVAAALLQHSGDALGAARSYEHIFEHARAMDAYESAGSIVDAARMAVTLHDGVALDRLVTLAIARGQGDQLLNHLNRGDFFAEAARVHLARGDLTAAAASYEAAGLLDRAATCHDDAGDLRAAGLLLERHLLTQPRDADASIRLGRILSRFGRHDDALAVLQAGAAGLSLSDVDIYRARACGTLLLSFVQLGYQNAAKATLAQWQQAHARVQAAHPHLEIPPTSLDEFLASERAVALAAIQAAPSRPARGAPAKVPSAPSAPVADDIDALLGASVDVVAVELDGAVARAPERAATIDDTLLLGGRYLLGEPLGGGGVGEVFRAYDAFCDRPVAVKIFGAHVLASDAVRAYANETRAFSSLRHPAIAELVELNVAQGFVVTELIQASLLEDRLQTGGTSGWLTPTFKALLDVLSAVHRTGLVHGGLKPTNVFVLDAGVRVVDVGAHRLLALRSTETGGLASVWPYLAPEQLFGAPASADGDLYAVAAMLFRALCGRPVFARAEQDRRQPPALASAVRADVPAAWDEFFSRALAVVPAERFVDAAQMAAALPSVAPPELPAASALGGHVTGRVIDAQSARYQRLGLVDRPHVGVRVYEGRDTAVERPVWLVEADDFTVLRPLVVCARLWRGVQPVYDVVPSARRVVVARDLAHEGSADLTALRAVPQGLARDLAAVAAALTWLHGQGWALGGFDVARALGPVGPRLSLVPAPLPVDGRAQHVMQDWEAFGRLVDSAFDLPADATLDGKGRVLAMLHDRRLLDRHDLDALGADTQARASWETFLEAVVTRLVQGASSRAVARLVKNVLRGAP